MRGGGGPLPVTRVHTRPLLLTPPLPRVKCKPGHEATLVFEQAAELVGGPGDAANHTLERVKQQYAPYAAHASRPLDAGAVLWPPLGGDIIVDNGIGRSAEDEWTVRGPPPACVWVCGWVSGCGWVCWWC